MARAKLEERQAEINEQNNNISAHQEQVKFEIPSINISHCEEESEEQTNHRFFGGKETRNQAMKGAENRAKKARITKDTDKQGMVEVAETASNEIVTTSDM